MYMYQLTLSSCTWFYFSYFRFFSSFWNISMINFPFLICKRIVWNGRVSRCSCGRRQPWAFEGMSVSLNLCLKNFLDWPKLNYWACTALGAFTKDRLLSCHLDDVCWCYFICLMFLFSERSYVWQTNFLLTSSCNMPSRWSIVIFFWKFIATFLGLNVCGI